jgi:hypothetical protein
VEDCANVEIPSEPQPKSELILAAVRLLDRASLSAVRFGIRSRWRGLDDAQFYLSEFELKTAPMLEKEPNMCELSRNVHTVCYTALACQV